MGHGRHAPPICNHLFFCDHFEELNIVFIGVQLIINNPPLTYLYPNTIKTYLTPNHFLFGRQLLCCSDTTSTVIRNLTVLSNTTDKINRIINSCLPFPTSAFDISCVILISNSKNWAANELTKQKND